MEINKKELYLSPEVKTFEVKQEGVICQSPAGIEATRDGYGNVIEDSWGGA